MKMISLRIIARSWARGNGETPQARGQDISLDLGGDGDTTRFSGGIEALHDASQGGGFAAGQLHAQRIQLDRKSVV